MFMNCYFNTFFPDLMSQYRSCAFKTGFAENHNNTVSFMFSKGKQWFEKETASKKAEKYLNTSLKLSAFSVFSLILRLKSENVTIIM